MEDVGKFIIHLEYYEEAGWLAYTEEKDGLTSQAYTPEEAVSELIKSIKIKILLN